MSLLQLGSVWVAQIESEATAGVRAKGVCRLTLDHMSKTVCVSARTRTNSEWVRGCQFRGGSSFGVLHQRRDYSHIILYGILSIRFWPSFAYLTVVPAVSRPTLCHRARRGGATARDGFSPGAGATGGQPHCPWRLQAAVPVVLTASLPELISQP